MDGQGKDQSIFQLSPPCGRRRGGGRASSEAGNFNPRLRVGGDRLRHGRKRRCDHFNSRLRVGGDMNTPYLRSLIIPFQLSPPRGRRRAETAGIRCCKNFNSRLRVGGDWSRATSASPSPYFNSRLRVGGDVRCGSLQLPADISTLASAWEATAKYNKNCSVFCSNMANKRWILFISPRSFPAWHGKSAERNSNRCADLPDFYGLLWSAQLKYQGRPGLNKRRLSHGFDPVFIGSSQTVNTYRISVRVNDFFHF